LPEANLGLSKTFQWREICRWRFPIALRFP